MAEALREPTEPATAPRRTILVHPDPALRRVSRPVDEFDEGLDALVDDLLEMLRRTASLGLAAPQLGDARRVLVIRPTTDASVPHVYVDPEIRSRSGVALVEERCLSVPGLSASVLRSTRIQVAARDRRGHPFSCQLEGMDAVCLQHELDHLDGLLFLDRLDVFRRVWLDRRARRLAARARAV